mmetsp:Transcript_51338/g.144219  ORF Transcript_51338/g.144219 Transcript_51338/m.144219 type:complete len:355 (-) Transcript_51338:141-1205(-)
MGAWDAPFLPPFLKLTFVFLPASSWSPPRPAALACASLKKWCAIASVADGRCSGSGLSNCPRNSRISLAPSTSQRASATSIGLGKLPPAVSVEATEGFSGAMASNCSPPPGVTGRSTWPSGVKKSSRCGCLATRLSGSGPKKLTKDTKPLLSPPTMSQMRRQTMASHNVTASCQTSTFSVIGSPNKASGGTVVPVDVHPAAATSDTFLAVSRLDNFQAPSAARQTVVGEIPQCAQPCACSRQRPPKAACAMSAMLAAKSFFHSTLWHSPQRSLRGMSSIIARRPGKASATSRNLKNKRFSVSKDSNCSRSMKHLTSTSCVRAQTCKAHCTCDSLSKTSKTSPRAPGRVTLLRTS